MSTRGKLGETRQTPPIVSAPQSDGRIAIALEQFRRTEKITSKGRLSQVLAITRVARRQGLPMRSDLQTQGGGQIKGASGPTVRAILADHGVIRTLSTEGGRTSRGSIAYINAYVELLNQLFRAAQFDVGAVETWWVDRVRDYFNNQPFSLRFDPSKNFRTVLRDLLSQAEKRQKEDSGTMFVGTMMQHLVGAKLELCLPGVHIRHECASTADAPSGRVADFLVGNAAIHVTAAPTESLMRKCRINIETGKLHPVIITAHRRLAAADQLAEQATLGDHIELLDIEQFLATNLLELGSFQTEKRTLKIVELVNRYNAIIERVETDPSLKIST